MRIAICDDNENDIERTREYIEKIFTGAEIADMLICTDGHSLLSELKNKSMDIVFLDIEMPGINGLETARKIREFDKHIMIVFLTGYIEFSLQGYEVSAFRYILKNQDESYYLQNFAEIHNEYVLKNKTLVIDARSGTKIFFLNDIFFIEVMNKDISIHTHDKSYEFSKTLSWVESRVDTVFFVKSHKSFIINAAHIDKIENSSIVFKNGKAIPLSRSFKENVVKTYLKYMTGGII